MKTYEIPFSIVAGFIFLSHLPSVYSFSIAFSSPEHKRHEEKLIRRRNGGTLHRKSRRSTVTARLLDVSLVIREILGFSTSWKLSIECDILSAKRRISAFRCVTFYVYRMYTTFLSSCRWPYDCSLFTYNED